MDSQSIEKTLLELRKNDINILISTQIIESGLDIENANTIIIDKSNWTIFFCHSERVNYWTKFLLATTAHPSFPYYNPLSYIQWLTSPIAAPNDFLSYIQWFTSRIATPNSP